jgi:methyl-accepting chemotaxis protein
MGLHFHVRSAHVWLLALVLPVAAPAAAAISNDPLAPHIPLNINSSDGAAKMVSMMQADSYNFQTTKSPNVWLIRFSGDHLKDIKVVLTVKDSTMVVFVTLVENQRMPVTTDFMRTLLEQNHELDRVKVGYDRDGDLSVRIDSNMRVMDATELRDIVNQVKNASDEIYGMIESSLLQ